MVLPKVGVSKTWWHLSLRLKIEQKLDKQMREEGMPEQRTDGEATRVGWS